MATIDRLTLEERRRQRRAERLRARHDRQNREKRWGKRWQEKAERMPEGTAIHERLKEKSELLLAQGELNDTEFYLRNGGVSQDRIDKVKQAAFVIGGVVARPVVDALDLLGRTTFAVGAAADEALEAVAGEGTASRKAIRDILSAGTNQFTFVPKSTDLPGATNPWNRALLGMANKTVQMLQSGELQEAAESGVNQLMAYEAMHGGVGSSALAGNVGMRVFEELFSGVDAQPVPDRVLSVMEFTGALPTPMVEAAREWKKKTTVKGEKRGLLDVAKDLGVDPGDSFSAAVERLTGGEGTFDIVPGVKVGFSDSGAGLLVFEKGGLLDWTSLGILGTGVETAVDPISWVTAGSGGAVRVGSRTLSAAGTARFKQIMDDMVSGIRVLGDDVSAGATDAIRTAASRQLLEEGRRAPELFAPKLQVRFMGQEMFNLDEPARWTADALQRPQMLRLKKAVEGFGEELGKKMGSETVSGAAARIGSRIQGYLDLLRPELSNIDEFIVATQAASGKAAAAIKRAEDVLESIPDMDEAANAMLFRVLDQPSADVVDDAGRTLVQVNDEIDNVYRGMDQLATKDVTEAKLRGLMTVLGLAGNSDQPIYRKLAERLNKVDWTVNPETGERTLRRTEMFFNNRDTDLDKYMAMLAQQFRGKIDIGDLQKALRAHQADPVGGEVGRLFDMLVAAQRQAPDQYQALLHRITELQDEAAELLIAKGDQGSLLSVLSRDDVLELMEQGRRKQWGRIRPVLDVREHTRRRAMLGYQKHAHRELAWTVWQATKTDEISRRLFEKHLIPVGDLERALSPEGVRRVDDAVRRYVDHVHAVRGHRRMRKRLGEGPPDLSPDRALPSPKPGRPMPAATRLLPAGKETFTHRAAPGEALEIIGDAKKAKARRAKRPPREDNLPPKWEELETMESATSYREGRDAIFNPWEVALSTLKTPEELQLFFRKWMVGDGMMSIIRQDTSLAERLGLAFSAGLGEVPSGHEPRLVHWFRAEGAAMREALRKNGLTMDDLIPSANLAGMVAEDGTNFVPFYRLVWGTDGRPKLVSKNQAIIHNGGKPVYLPESLIKALDRLTERSIKSPSTGRILGAYDKATNFVKVALTGVGGYPSFQLRNAYTNFFLAGTEAHLHLLQPGATETAFTMAFTGLDPRLAVSGAAHMNALRMRAASIASLDPAGFDLPGLRRAVDQAFASSRRGRKLSRQRRRDIANELWDELNQVAIRVDPGAPVPQGFAGYTNHDLIQLVHQHGIEIDPKVLSEFTGHADKFRRLNRAQRASLWFRDKALRNNQFWEQFARQQMFFAYLARGFDPADAARFTKKALFDYLALSPGEREFAKRVIPFYTFYRKAIPFMMESLVRRPGPMALQARLLREDPDDPSMIFGTQAGERFVVRSKGKIHQVGNIDHPINTLRFVGALYGALGLGKPMENTAIMKQGLHEIALMLHPGITGLFEASTSYELFTGKSRDQKKLQSLGLALDKAGMLDGQLGNVVTKREFGQDTFYSFDKNAFTWLVQATGGQRLVSNADRIVAAIEDFSDGELTGLIRWATGLKAESISLRGNELKQINMIHEAAEAESIRRDTERQGRFTQPTDKGLGLTD